MRLLTVWLAVGLVALAGCGKSEKEPAGGKPGKKGETGKGEPAAKGGKTLTVTSAAFEDKGAIPPKHSDGGGNVSPPIAWSGAPEGTQEFALICDDPDAPEPNTPWVHWVVYKIPADRTSLAEGDVGGARQGKTDSGQTRYGGPAPPAGVHRYFFKVYALDVELDLAPGATKQQLLDAMEGHVLAKGELVGTFKAE